MNRGSRRNEAADGTVPPASDSRSPAPGSTKPLRPRGETEGGEQGGRGAPPGQGSLRVLLLRLQGGEGRAMLGATRLLPCPRPAPVLPPRGTAEIQALRRGAGGRRAALNRTPSPAVLRKIRALKIPRSCLRGPAPARRTTPRAGTSRLSRPLPGHVSGQSRSAGHERAPGSPSRR